jgi:hypothetical protein
VVPTIAAVPVPMRAESGVPERGPESRPPGAEEPLQSDQQSPAASAPPSAPKARRKKK